MQPLFVVVEEGLVQRLILLPKHRMQGEREPCHYDYLEISSQYTIILFSHVPQLDGKNGGAVRRLIVGSRLAFEFQRTRSRLREMLNGVM